MKKKVLLLTFTLGVLAFTFMSNSGGRATVAQADNTGANGGAFCQNCHSAGAFSPSLTIEILEEGTANTVTQYMPGTVYDVKITVNSSGGASGFGTQMTVLDASNNPVTGFSTPSANAQVASLNGGEYLEHDGMSSTNEFTAKWTAPIAGTGDVSFFAAGVAVDGNGMSGGDGATKNDLTLTEDMSSSILQSEKLAANLKVFPNPVQDVLNLETIGTTLGQHTLTITNMAGKTVHNQQINLFGNDRTQLDVSHLAAGNYNLVLSHDGKVATKKIVKQ